MTARTLKLTCSEHGDVAFKSFCFGGIELSCGCQFLCELGGQGKTLVYHAIPPWVKKPQPTDKANA